MEPQILELRNLKAQRDALDKQIEEASNSIAPKFIGPNGETWAGRGRKPLWLQQAEQEGKTAEDFRIVPHSFEPKSS